MTATRFYVRGVSAGVRTILSDEAAHHAVSVLRLRRGCRVRVFDGAGNEYDAEIEDIAGKRVAFHVLGAVAASPESPLRIVLAVPPLRGDRMELVIQKATELGVAEIWPVVTVRTDAAARPAFGGARHPRWERVAIGAAEQCGRAVVPPIVPAMRLETLFATPFSGPRLVFQEGSETSLWSLSPPPTTVLALVGPPGGWDPVESASLVDGGFRTIGLGPRTLRTETAAISAVTALQLLWGDLHLGS